MTQKVCGAKTRSGKPCQKLAIKGRTRCKYHGGKTLKGTEHPNFIHGRYSKWAKLEFQEKMNALDENPLDALPELQIMRATMAWMMEHRSKHMGSIFGMAQEIIKSVALLMKVRNETAFTAAEIRFIQSKMIQVMEKYVTDPTKQREYLNDIRALIPGSSREEEGLDRNSPGFISTRTIEAGETT